jgi:hypothetical protein
MLHEKKGISLIVLVFSIAVLVIIGAIVISGIVKKDKESFLDNNILNSDIIIGGNKYTLPVDFSELEKKENLELDSEMYITELESLVSFDSSLYLKTNNVFSVTFQNRTEKKDDIKNSKIISVSQLGYQVQFMKIIFPGDLYVGKKMTQKEVISLLGKPTDTEETGNGIILKYGDKDSFSNINSNNQYYYEISISSDIINSLELLSTIEK